MMASGVGLDKMNGDDDRQLFDDTVDQIKRDHLEAARKAIVNSKEVLQEVEEELEYDCERLRGFLRAAQVRSVLLGSTRICANPTMRRSSTRSRHGQRTSLWASESDCLAASLLLPCGIGCVRFRCHNHSSLTSRHMQGIDSELVSLESIIDWDVLGDEAEVASKSADGPPQLGQEFYSKLSQRLGERLAECGDRVPVVTGVYRSVCSSERSADTSCS